MRVTRRELGDLRGQHGGQRMRVLGACDGDHLRHAGNARRFRSNRGRVGGQHGHVDLAAQWGQLTQYALE